MIKSNDAIQLHILIVDSDAKCRIIPGLIIRPFGFTVREAKNETEAFDVLNSFRPNVIFIGNFELTPSFLHFINNNLKHDIIFVKYGYQHHEINFSFEIKRPAVSLDILSVIEYIYISKKNF